MNKPSGKNEPTGYPEFAVRAQTIGRYFSPPLATSTFHDFVNKGKIVPIKGIRGFYKLNDSLRRLGLREVPELPMEVPSRTAEEIIRIAFNAIDPDVFTATLAAGCGGDRRGGDTSCRVGLRVALGSCGAVVG